MRLYAVEEQAEEQVLPAVRGRAGIQPLRPAGGGEPGRVRRQHVEAEAVPEGSRHRQALEGRGRRHAAAVPPELRARQRQQRLAVGDEVPPAGARAIPLQEGEFGMVGRRALAVAEDARELKEARLAGDQQLLHREFGR